MASKSGLTEQIWTCPRDGQYILKLRSANYNNKWPCPLEMKPFRYRLTEDDNLILYIFSPIPLQSFGSYMPIVFMCFSYSNSFFLI